MSHRLGRGGPEDGMTMIELMVAMVVFAIAASAIVAGLIATMQSTRSSKNRLQASSLAAREMEILRNEFNSSAATALAVGSANVVNPHPLPGGTAGADLKVDGAPYTVVRNVQWLPAGTGQSACDGGAALTYPSLAVNVKVTWPMMGSVKAVESNTVLTPPKNTVELSTLGFVGVKVVGVTNAPVPNQTVTLIGPGGPFTDTTGADGCAVFAVPTANSTTTYAYTVSLDTAGAYVDPIRVTNPSQAVSVKASTLVQKSFTYDEAANLAITLTTDVGYALPTTLPRIALYNTGIQPIGVMSVASTGTVTNIGALWPYTDGYALWAGSCPQSDPLVAGGDRDAGVPTSPGASEARDVRLAPVGVTVTTPMAVPVPNVTVTATPADTLNCVAPDEFLILGVTDPSGVLMTSLPVGEWILNVTGMTGSATTDTLLQTSAASSYILSVS